MKKKYKLTFFLSIIFTLSPFYWASAKPIPHSGTCELPKPSISPNILSECKNYNISYAPPSLISKFWTRNFINKSTELIRAELAGQNSSVIIYLQEGVSLEEDIINSLLLEMENNIIPQVRSVFGHEPVLDIDEDNRLTILIYDIQDNYDLTGLYYAGYFSAEDLFPKEKYPYSNQKKMIYVDLIPGIISGDMDDIYSILAHEYQHLIHFCADPNEVKWVDEGCANLASFLCGYGEPEQHTRAFQVNSDNSLISWDGTLEDYGSSFLFMKYIYEKFDRGTGIVKRIVNNKKRCRSGIEAELKGPSFTEVFSDWAIANILDTYKTENNFQYDDLSVRCIPRKSIKKQPWTLNNEIIKQFSTHYYRLYKCGNNDLSITINPNLGSGEMLVQWVGISNRNGYLLSRKRLIFSQPTTIEIKPSEMNLSEIYVIVSNISETNINYGLSTRINGPQLSIVPNPILPTNILVIMQGESIDDAMVLSKGSTIAKLEMKDMGNGCFLSSFDPKNTGIYEIIVHGNSKDGDYGKSISKINVKAIVNGLYQEWDNEI